MGIEERLREKFGDEAVNAVRDNGVLRQKLLAEWILARSIMKQTKPESAVDVLRCAMDLHALEVTLSFIKMITKMMKSSDDNEGNLRDDLSEQMLTLFAETVDIKLREFTRVKNLLHAVFDIDVDKQLREID